MINIDIAEQLFPNPLTMITQLLATGILFFFVYRFLWNPAREMLAKRAEFVQSELTNAENAKKDAENNLKAAKEEISKAVTTSKDIVSRAEKEAIDVKEELIQKAQKEAQAKLDKAREEIEIEKKQMRSEMIEEMVDVAMYATEKLIGEKADETYDKKAIDKFVKEVTKS